MPYAKKKENNKWKVINKNTKKVFGTHDTEEKADKQIAALYANVKESNTIDEKTQLDESNSYIRKVSQKSGLSQEKLSQLWDICVTDQERNGKTLEERTKAKVPFWKCVRKKFDKKISELDIKEATYIMDNRSKLTKNIETFLDSMANDNYTAAKESLPSMLSSKINLMIDARREQFLKDIGNKAKSKAKES